MNLKHTVIAITMILPSSFAWGEHVIVSSDFAETPEFSLASKFLNRYATILDEPQTQDSADLIRRTKEDGFRYEKGNDAALKTLIGDEDFSISFENGYYTAQWSKNGQTKVLCTFPANIGLLTFSNKIELENNLIEEITSQPVGNDTISMPIRKTSALKPVSFSDFFIEDKGFYITPRLKHQLVFKKDTLNNEECVLLNDSTHYQLESVANMMLSGYSVNPHQVSLKVNQYGYKSQTFPAQLSSLHSFLSQDGTIPYWGVETFDGKIVKGLWVWINRQGGFAHMLTVTLPTTVLSESSQIDAKLHCYLRLDNLKSLFEEYPNL